MTARIIVSASTVRRLASDGLCQSEIATALGISLSTIKARIFSDPHVRAAWKEGRAISEHRQREAMRRPRRFERRFQMNLHADLASQILKRAEMDGITPHSVIVRAVERHLAA